MKNYFGAKYHRFKPVLDTDIKLDDISQTSKQALFAASEKMLAFRDDEFKKEVVAPLKARTLS